MTGEDIVLALSNIQNNWGKYRKKRSRRQNEPKSMWKKKSIFFNLPYWKELDLRHNLDVMHIEKNVCDSIIGTLLNIKGKTKDGIESRRDLVTMGIRQDLQPNLLGDKI